MNFQSRLFNRWRRDEAVIDLFHRVNGGRSAARSWIESRWSSSDSRVAFVVIPRRPKKWSRVVAHVITPLICASTIWRWGAC
jgi:hypothetical protein